MLSDRLLGYINYYKLSQAIFIAVEIGLFEQIKSPASVLAISAELRTNSSATEILLNVFTGIGLVEKKDKFYSLTTESEKLLVKDADASMVPMIEFESYLSIENLNIESMKLALAGEGKDKLNLGNKKGKEMLYGKVMNNGGKFAALCVARSLPANFKGRMLDLGGGAGTFAVQLARLNNQITVDIFDKLEMKSICERNITENKMHERVRFFTRDILKKLPFEMYDGILISNILHLFDEHITKRIIINAVEALVRGGTIILHDFFLNESKTGPHLPLLYTLDWMTNGSNFNFSFCDIDAWLEPLGVEKLKHTTYPQIPTSIISGIKKKN